MNANVEMEFHIEESPYGDSGATYTGALGMFQHFILQLRYLQRENDTEYIRADIQGYQEVVDSGSEENALTFLEMKDSARLSGNHFANNREVVKEMKRLNKWKAEKAGGA